MKLQNVRLLAAAAALSLAAPIASAASVDVDLTDVDSFGFQGDPGNTVLSLDIGAGSTITGISWDITLAPVSPSWSEEAIIGFTTDQGATDIQLFPGNQTSDPISDAGSLAFSLGTTDGMVNIEFYEVGFDDIAGGADATWGGTLTVEFDAAVVPVPAAVWLMGSGLLGLIGLRRRA
ncbi:MAG: PEP-CTERM sorting domain-containing protein [Pseudomonadota bacterium]